MAPEKLLRSIAFVFKPKKAEYTENFSLISELSREKIVQALGTQNSGMIYEDSYRELVYK